ELGEAGRGSDRLVADDREPDLAGRQRESARDRARIDGVLRNDVGMLRSRASRQLRGDGALDIIRGDVTRVVPRAAVGVIHAGLAGRSWFGEPDVRVRR